MIRTNSPRIVAIGLALVAASSGGAGLLANEIGFLERFALADDRAEALAELVPGTPDFYFFSALLAQQEGRFDEVEELLQTWEKRYGKGERLQEIRHRQALLTYPDQPEATFDYLQRTLGLRFDHEKDRLRESPDFPTRLDPAVISWEAYFGRGPANQNLSHLDDRGLDRILRDEVVLNPVQRRELLGRLQFPDYERLVGLVAADLRAKESRGFGEFEIHGRLTDAQLVELLGLRPELLEDPRYIDARIRRLRPAEGSPSDLDGDELDAYLASLWDFVKDLAPSFHSLRASVLYRRLEQGRKRGEFSEELFLDYLRLPRQMPYVEPRYLRENARPNEVADLGVDHSASTGFGPIISDEPLVRAYLEHFFRELETYRKFAPYVRESYLRTVFAETKLQYGIGDPEEWYAMLGPGRVDELLDRVEISFLPGNPSRMKPEDEVSLAVELKNVPELLVKTYRIQAFNYYRDEGREIGTDLDLDGLVAHEERSIRFDEAPIRRHREMLEFEDLAGKRGVWVIELIGNGISSRALIRKGHLHYVSRTTPGGELVRVLTESNELAEDPAIWFGGERYRPDESGLVLLPFSTTGKNSLILTGSGISSLATLDLPREKYRLDAGILLSQESLLPGSLADLAVRPRLSIGGKRTDPTLLEKVRLSVRMTDADGIESISEQAGFPLSNTGESTHRFRVPDRLRRIEVELTASLPRVSPGEEPQEFRVNRAFDVNGVDSLPVTTDLFLTRTVEGYRIEVRGRSGEVAPDRPVAVRLRHRDFVREHTVMLKSDEDGFVHLGSLDGIEQVGASLEGERVMGPRTWELRERGLQRPRAIQLSSGDDLMLPVGPAAGGVERRDVALFSVKEGTIAEDLFEKTRREEGRIVLEKPEPGDYLVHFRDDGRTVPVRVTASEASSLGFVLGARRVLESGGSALPEIRSIEAGEETIEVAIDNASESARVHLVATRFLPSFPPFDSLTLPEIDGLTEVLRGRRDTLYVSGRDIGEEYRYILERQRAARFPGNLLPRPGLLLNPWATQDTSTEHEEAAEGDDYERKKGMAEDRRRDEPGARPASKRKMEREAARSPALTFLGTGPVILANLEIEEGKVVIDREQLRDRQHLHLVVVDGEWAASRSLAVAPPIEETPFRDLRLEESLETEQGFTQRRNVTLLLEDETLEIDDFRSARLESYGTVGDVFSALQAVRHDPNLEKFSFVRNWPDLEPAERRELYSEHACHELHFFLSRKDPDFFEEVVRPYLANKKDKTFLDHYLLESDLTSYLQPWEFARLNVVERILLARRIGAEEMRSTRMHVEDLFELIPPDPMRDAVYFRKALLGRRSDPDAGGAVALGLMPAEPEGAMVVDAFADAPVAPAPARMGGQVRGADVTLSTAAARRVSAFAGGGVAKSAPMAEALAAEELGRDGLQARGLREVAQQQALYEVLDSTKEWAENNYYELPISQQDAGLVEVNAFWKDFAAWDGEGGFYSREFPAATRNFTEMMFALGVLGLPFESEEPEIEVDGQTLRYTAKSPSMVFHEEIEASDEEAEGGSLLVSQNFFRDDDRYRVVDGQRRDKFVTEEFLTGVVYGSQVVVTNPTSTPQLLEFLIQVPQGAVPVASSDYTKSYPMTVPAFSTQLEEVRFYFPEPSGADGFPIYPVQVSQGEQVVAAARPFSFLVVERASEVDETSWNHLSQEGTEDAVLDFLRTENLQLVDLSRIAWRVRRDPDLLERVVRIVTMRHAYDDVIWSYGVHHRLPDVAREYLKHREGFLRQCGPSLESELVRIDPVQRRWYEHLEYSPLVHARTHRLGRHETILNDQFFEQYQSFLGVLSRRVDFSPETRLDVAAYLLLQDRIEEGLQWEETVNRDEVETVIQQDYLAAYSAIYREDLEQAAELARGYEDHPVKRWRERFGSVLSQVAEIRGDEGDQSDEAREQRLDRLSSADSSVDLSVEGSRVTVAYRNVEEARLNYYEMDLEFLFSSQPFVSGDSRKFGFIEPNLTQIVALPEGGDSLDIALPERFDSRNVLVEVIAGGERVTAPVFSNQLRVDLSDRYGRIEVREREEGKPLPKTYVKVYARMGDGTVRFYKDGYTDLRGKFDYVSLSTNEIENVERLSLLVMHETGGALVREVDPPQR